MKPEQATAHELHKAIQSGSAHTANYSSGLQVKGVFAEVLEDREGGVAYLRTAGPTCLSYRGTEIVGHGGDYHREGFGSPVGFVQGFSRCLSQYSLEALRASGIATGQRVTLEYASGITVDGELQQIFRQQDINLILTFTDCAVTSTAGRVLFEPAWGDYDLALGSGIISVWPGLF